MRILNIGSNVPLLHLRGAFLEALGFAVANVPDVLEALRELHLAVRPYDVAVLCHSLSNANKLWFDSAIQDISRKPIVLELYLAKSPITSGIALDAATHFQRTMVTWSPSFSTCPEPEVDRTRCCRQILLERLRLRLVAHEIQIRCALRGAVRTMVFARTEGAVGISAHAFVVAGPDRRLPQHVMMAGHDDVVG